MPVCVMYVYIGLPLSASLYPVNPMELGKIAGSIILIYTCIYANRSIHEQVTTISLPISRRGVTWPKPKLNRERLQVQHCRYTQTVHIQRGHEHTRTGN